MTSAAVVAAEVADPGDDLEALAATNALAVATTDPMDSDEVYAALNGTEGGDGKSRACRNADIVGTMITVDYSACEHMNGTITLERQALGVWLLTFEEDFVIGPFDIDGAILLTRESSGTFAWSTDVDGSGETEDDELIKVSWPARSGKAMVRTVAVDGEVSVVDQPLAQFAVTGKGVLGSKDGSQSWDLGLGGLDQSAPLLLDRPLSSTCPRSGRIGQQGGWTFPLATTLAFDVQQGDKLVTYYLDVDLGNVARPGVCNLDFANREINAVGLVLDSRLIAKTAIEQALNATSLATFVKNTIRNQVNARYSGSDPNAESYGYRIPQELIDAALTTAFTNAFAETICTPLS